MSIYFNLSHFKEEVKSILCIVNYMITSNIHNRTPKSGILFTDICIGDFCNKHDFMRY